MGWTGLKHEQGIRKDFNYYDLGYRLIKKYQEEGIASETAIESLKYRFEELDLKEIGAVAAVNHIASNKILKKVGLKFIETFDHGGVPHNWYTITKQHGQSYNEPLKNYKKPIKNGFCTNSYYVIADKQL